LLNELTYNIPIDPVILVDLGPWEGTNLQLHDPPVDGLINPEITCLYPDPPTIFHSPANPSGDPGERDGSDDGGIHKRVKR
jgi:hypothetical protein